ncbi:monocarboxylate transporter 7-like [Carettochelys insculpta]|uniref:monocarboxylate transporter 7-like n=1 Tax=Carettochelys insculpta TaxID=44489 RepID=UPI003EBB49F8
MQGRISSPPDGGYGWVVVVAAFTVMGLTVAVLKTFGLFFVEIQQHFDELASTTSWITSITIAMFHLGAPVASSLSVRYTHRIVVIIGGLLAFSGMTLGSLGFNTLWMYTTMGFLQGSMQLNICVCGALMRPLKDSCVPEAKSFEAQRSLCKVVPKTEKKHASIITQKTFNWMLVKRVEFMLYAIFGILAAMNFFIPPLFLVPLSYSLRIDESWTASLLSALAITDFMSRLLCGWYANLHLTRTIHLLTMAVVLISTSLVVLPLANNYLSLAIFTGFYGFFFGATVSIHITVVADVVGMSDFDSALGLFMLIRSTGGFLGPALAGLIVYMAGNYSMGFYMAGATLILSTVFLVIIDQLQQKKDQENQTDIKSKQQILFFPSLHFLGQRTGKGQEQVMGV